MAIEYRFRIDEEYVATAHARLQSLRGGYRWFLIVKVICGLVLGGLVIFLAWRGVFGGAAMLAGFLVLLAVSGRISGWLGTPRNVRKKLPRFGEEVVVELSDEGIHIRESVVESRATWQYIRTARRVTEGCLLFDERDKPRWLPDAATRSTPSEIEALLRTALPDRVVA